MKHLQVTQRVSQIDRGPFGRLFAGVLVVATTAVTGCSDDDGSESGAGSLAVQISGEEAAQSGYPVGSGDNEIAFADGWTFEFSKVLVSLSNFDLKTSQGGDAQLPNGPIVANLHTGEHELWNFDNVPARRWDRVGYLYEPPTADSTLVGGVTAEDVALLQERGWSLYIEGTAHKGEQDVDIAWGFPFTVQLTECEAADGTYGVVVENNAQSLAQVTVHLDHLFFDSFVTEEPNLRFDAMAAVAPSSGPLTLDDLAQQDNLTDLKAADGTSLGLGYDPGSTFNPVPANLRDYVIAAATTTGHWNGEGHCIYERLQ